MTQSSPTTTQSRKSTHPPTQLNAHTPKCVHTPHTTHTHTSARTHHQPTQTQTHAQTNKTHPHRLAGKPWPVQVAFRWLLFVEVGSHGRQILRQRRKTLRGNQHLPSTRPRTDHAPTTHATTRPRTNARTHAQPSVNQPRGKSSLSRATVVQEPVVGVSKQSLLAVEPTPHTIR